MRVKRAVGLLAGVLVLATGIGYLARQMATMRQELNDWPQLGRYAAENAALGGVPSGTKRVVFFGDSITDIWGRLPNRGTFFQGKAYVNRGISGQTTAQMVARFRQDVIDLNPSVVVILAGTNDVAENTGPMTPKMTEDNFASMVDMAKENGIKVVIASITPTVDYPWRKGMEPVEKIKALNLWLETFCKERELTYLDYYSALVDAQGGMKEGTSSDGVHPTTRGFALMEPLAQAAIDQALSKN